MLVHARRIGGLQGAGFVHLHITTTKVLSLFLKGWYAFSVFSLKVRKKGRKEDLTELYASVILYKNNDGRTTEWRPWLVHLGLLTLFVWIVYVSRKQDQKLWSGLTHPTAQQMTRLVFQRCNTQKGTRLGRRWIVSMKKSWSCTCQPTSQHVLASRLHTLVHHLHRHHRRRHLHSVSCISKFAAAQMLLLHLSQQQEPNFKKISSLRARPRRPCLSQLSINKVENNQGFISLRFYLFYYFLVSLLLGLICYYMPKQEHWHTYPAS